MEPFKEQLNLKNALIIASAFLEHYKKFDHEYFAKSLKKSLPELELKQRVQIIAKTLADLLPKDPNKAFPIIVAASQKIPGFKSWPLNDLVVLYGMDYLELSLETLCQLTSQASAEFAIRPFLIHQEKKSLTFLKKKLNNSNHHIRRLISEGTRPLLPWGQHIPRFKNDPTLTWNFLEKLKNDSSEYVRKSVANHLNDHTKNHGPWIMNQIKDWDNLQDKNISWIIKHGLRTLIKNGDPKALGLIGINHSSIEILDLKISTKSITLGDTIQASFKIKNLTDKYQSVVIDQKISLLRSNNKYNDKVFKGKIAAIGPNEIMQMKLNLKIREVTTRKYYPGKQYYSVVANGKDSKRVDILLKD